MRGQTELLAIGIAFVLLTSTVVAGVILSNNALSATERPALERQTAATLSDRLVSEEATHTARKNVLSDDNLESLDEAALREVYDIPAEKNVEITLDGEAVIETGSVTDGATIERIVLVERRTTEEVRPDFNRSRSVTLPRRTSNATLSIDPPQGTTVERVHANERVVLSNESGLQGTFEVDLSSLETTTLRFEAAGVLDEESVRIEYAPPETTKATLRVSVDG